MSQIHPSTRLLLILVCASITPFSFVDRTTSEPAVGGENVCNISVPITKDEIVMIPIQYRLKVNAICGVLPCTKTVVETRLDEQIKTVVSYINKIECCKGYAESPDGSCAPICLDSCQNGGKCVAPGVCECQREPSDTSPGYAGPTCKRFVCLNSNVWGRDCDKKCSCYQNSYCHAKDGQCICYPGWKGENCSIACTTADGKQCGGESFELPPIVDSDVNVMDNIIGMSQKLEAAEGFGRTPDEVLVSKSQWNSQSSLIICSFAPICFILLVALYVFMRRYEAAKRELYYARCYSTSNRPPNPDGSQYSEAYYASVNHPYSEPIGDSTGQLSKNLSFDAATRNVLASSEKTLSGREKDPRYKPVLDLRLESHLISSQEHSKGNLYSKPNLDSMERAQSEEHIYQVPKSPSPSKGGLENVSVHSYDEDKSNIYEEIKPRTPPADK